MNAANESLQKVYILRNILKDDVYISKIYKKNRKQYYQQL